MGTIVTQFSTAFRDFVTDGVSSSGAHDVVKSDVRAIGPLIEAAIANVGLAGLVSVIYATKALLDADLAHVADTTALVYADATDANNDLYVKVGASGAGSWTLTGALHGIIEGLAQPYVDAAEAAQAAAEAAAASASDILEPNAINPEPNWWLGDEEGNAGALFTPTEIFHPAIQALQVGLADVSNAVTSDINFYSDSLGDGYDGFTPPLTFLAAALGRTGNRFAIPGQAIAQIASRQSGHVRELTLSGNEISIGANTVTHIDGSTIAALEALSTGRKTGALFLSTPGNAATYTIKGWIGGIRGTLTRTRPASAEVYTFTPDDSFASVLASPISIAASVPFVVDVDSTSSGICIIWGGTNDIPPNGAGAGTFTAFKDSVKAEIALMISALPHRRFLILSILNFSTQYPGGDANCYNALVELEDDLATLYPSNIVPVRKGLIQRGLSLQGITATAQDLIDIGNDVVPDSLRSDTVHLNDDGYEAVSKLIQERIQAKGW